MSGAEQFNIGEAASRSGVLAKTVLHCDSRGLLPAVARTDSGYRRYSDKEVHTLRFIRRARDQGFSIAEIAELLKHWQNRRRASADVKRVAQRHLLGLERRMAAMPEMRKSLKHLADCCQGDQRPDCPILEDLSGHEAVVSRRRCLDRGLQADSRHLRVQAGRPCRRTGRLQDLPREVEQQLEDRQVERRGARHRTDSSAGRCAEAISSPHRASSRGSRGLFSPPAAAAPRRFASQPARIFTDRTASTLRSSCARLLRARRRQAVTGADSLSGPRNVPAWMRRHSQDREMGTNISTCGWRRKPVSGNRTTVPVGRQKRR